jgi:quercetin dioxygenase-like cupin family protein
MKQHCHHHDTVKFYKCGKVQYTFAQGDPIIASQGDALFFPAGSAYAVENIGDEPALIHTSTRPIPPSPLTNEVTLF